MQLHVRTEPGRVAPYVLLPGDPGRARFVAETYLENAECTTEYRGLLGFTGRYRGAPVTVQTTGMGCPSLAIVVEELIRLGARTLIRIGTAGLIADSVEPGERIVAEAAEAGDGTTRQYLGGIPLPPVSSFAVTTALHDAAAAHGGAHLGLIRTEDAFYATTPADVPGLAARGILAIEMEAAALFTLGRLRGVQTGCMVVASNRIGDTSFVAPEVLQAGVDAMVRSSLDAIVALHEAKG